MAEANLIITYDPSHAAHAKAEVEALLKEVKETAKFLKSETDGIFKVRVKDAKKAVAELSKVAKKQAKKFEQTFHWVPIDQWTRSSIKDMQKAVAKLEKGIQKTEKWSMDLAKRNFKQHEHELVLKLTEVVDKPKVDLKKPDKVIKVEIIGNKAGISLLKKGELLKIKHK